MSSLSQAQIDENYRRKLAARANGTTPLILNIPDPASIKGDSPEAVEARYRAKMSQRLHKPEAPKAEAPAVEAAPAAAPSATPEAAAKSETEAPKGKPEKGR